MVAFSPQLHFTGEKIETLEGGYNLPQIHTVNKDSVDQVLLGPLASLHPRLKCNLLYLLCP